MIIKNMASPWGLDGVSKIWSGFSWRAPWGKLNIYRASAPWGMDGVFGFSLQTPAMRWGRVIDIYVPPHGACAMCSALQGMVAMTPARNWGLYQFANK